jgi:N-acetylated-alpha-linked acidic dipeptidase
VHLQLKQDYQYRPIWDVIGTIRGAEKPEEWVVAGNHRDAWVYGAVDPNSGTAAMLETVHGIGTLLKSGWKPKRTLIFGSWDAEEEGLIGSTEWAEQHASELRNADAYFNMDVGVSGSHFGASAVPSLKQFIRDLSKAVPTPDGPPLYEVWKEQKKKQAEGQKENPALAGEQQRPPAAPSNDVPVGDLGSGSDYTAFLQHLGVPSTDIASTGSYGVYHSVFDNFAWFTKFGDPNFVYEQQMARVFGLEALRMADADVLPYDYENYGREILDYVQKAQKKAAEKWGGRAPNFGPALDAARRLQSAGASALNSQRDASVNPEQLNSALRAAERALLLPDGLPGRPWFKHAIYAPGRYTGYAAVVIPGVNEAIDANDEATAERELTLLTEALNRAAADLQQIH